MSDRREMNAVVRVALNIGLVLVATMFALVLAEGVLAVLDAGGPQSENWRTRGLHRHDSELIFSQRPAARSEWSTPEFVERATTNSIGLRGPEVEEGPIDHARVLILGDSMTFGHGVGDLESYPARLDALLAARRPDLAVEVINAGTKGYGTDHSYKLFMTRLRDLSPSVVVFALNYNDIDDNFRYPLYELDGDRLVELDATESPLYKVAKWSDRLPNALARRRLARLAVQAGVRLSTPALPSSREEGSLRAEERRRLVLQLRSLAAAGEEDGFDLLVLGLPRREGERTPFAWLREPLRGSIRLLDLGRDPSWRTQRLRWFFASDEHLNEVGHERVAEVLYDFMTEQGWLGAVE